MSKRGTRLNSSLLIPCEYGTTSFVSFSRARTRERARANSFFFSSSSRNEGGGRPKREMGNWERWFLHVRGTRNESSETMNATSDYFMLRFMRFCGFFCFATCLKAPPAISSFLFVLPPLSSSSLNSFDEVWKSSRAHLVRLSDA